MPEKSTHIYTGKYTYDVRSADIAAEYYDQDLHHEAYRQVSRNYLTHIISGQYVGVVLKNTVIRECSACKGKQDNDQRRKGKRDLVTSLKISDQLDLNIVYEHNFPSSYFASSPVISAISIPP